MRTGHAQLQATTGMPVMGFPFVYGYIVPCWLNISSVLCQARRVKSRGGSMGNQQKIAIVTGAASGIGKASAERLIREGMCVIVTDIERESGEAVVRKALAAGFVSEYMRLDVQDEDSWKDVLRTVERRHRRD